MASAVPTSETQGWQLGKSLPECLFYMFKNRVGCDVKFQIQSRNEFMHTVPAHRFILTARSPEFENILKQSSHEEINICDIEVEPFKEMMRYIYAEEVHFTGENVMHILYAAKKYKIQGLHKACKDYIDNKLHVVNVSGILSAAVLYEDGQLVNKCVAFIARHTKEVVKTTGFYKMSQDALLKLLESDILPNSMEEEIYLGCVEWAKHQNKKYCTDEELRATLGKCLYQIRFLQMSSQTFAAVVGKSNILTGDEKSSFLCALLTQEMIHKVKLVKFGFNMESRVISVDRFDVQNKTSFILPTNNNRSESFELKANQPISVIGFSICSSQNAARHTVTATITDGSKGKELAKVEKEVFSDGLGNYHQVLLPKTKLEPHVTYNVNVSVVGTYATGHGENLRSSLGTGKVTITNKETSWPFTQNKYDGYYGTYKNIYKGYTSQILVINNN